MVKAKEIVEVAVHSFAVAVWLQALTRLLDSDPIVAVAMVLATIGVFAVWLWKEYQK